MIKLFPDIQLLNQDLHTLEPHLDKTVIPDLRKLIEYWNIREQIVHIRQGFINIQNYLQEQIIDQPSSFSEVLSDISENASGAVCFEAYENYYNNYSKHYLSSSI